MTSRSIGSDKAIRGRNVQRSHMDDYPLTFRLMGPNNNDFFAWWNQMFTMAFVLVAMHPVTDKFIPIMATHWSVQPDQKTIYFKLDPDARFSDGKPVTADDYVFTWKMMQSKFIVDPFFNSYAERYLRVGRQDRRLHAANRRNAAELASACDYAGLWPTPAHATVARRDLGERTNNQPQIAVGPYVVSEVERGHRSP